MAAGSWRHCVHMPEVTIDGGPMRVAFIESYPHVLYGQQRTLLALLAECAETDIEPIVGVTAEGLFTAEVRRRGYTILQLPYPDSIAAYGGAVYRTRGWRKLRMMWQVAGYVRQIRRKLKASSVDAVYCNDMRALLTAGTAARSLGIPVMIWDKLDKPHGWMDWLQLPLVSTNVIISDAVRSKYPRWQQRRYAAKMVKIADGVDARALEASSLSAPLPNEPGDVLLGIVGSVSSRKGHDLLLTCWPALVRACPQLRLLIVGDSEDPEYVSSLPNKDHPRIHFLGARSDVPAIMNLLDILVTPSRYEGLGLVNVEAMAAGVPVVGANRGGIPEVVVDGVTGLLVDPDNPSQLAEAILRLATSAELRKRFGMEGRERARASFDRTTQMRKVSSTLRELRTA
jgi:glycosyltransferase involved in cell wall biosynthesis